MFTCSSGSMLLCLQHFRNFLKEVGSRGSAKKGLKEIGPEQAARDLLGHLKPGDKVAIVNAFGREYVQPYVDAFEGRNLTVRVIEGQTGIEDFCFLMSTQKEMFGIAYSTFFVWAGVLSNSSRVVAYSMDTKGAANRYGIGTCCKRSKNFASFSVIFLNLHLICPFSLLMSSSLNLELFPS